MFNLKESIKLEVWPTPQDYNEAIQHPAQNLADAELRKAKPETDRFDLPRPVCGAFASVYRMNDADKSYALRCFLRNVHDQEERYKHVSEFVLHDSLTYTVGFDFQSNGINVNGAWYPTLKMDWIEGETLDHFVEKNHRDSTRMNKLAESFKKMYEDLQGAGVAHCDLQHANIIVKNDELFLVDYDGMFVPSMQGWSSNELGHRNYQHPDRTGSDFGVHVDNFSAWVIYTSLLALARHPELYETLQVGNDCLLFTKDDFLTPDQSPAFYALEHSVNDAELARLSRAIRACLKRSLSSLPKLLDFGSLKLPDVEDTTGGARRSRTQISSASSTYQAPPRLVVEPSKARSPSVQPHAAKGLPPVFVEHPELSAPTPRKVKYRAKGPHPAFFLLIPHVWVPLLLLLSTSISLAVTEFGQDYPGQVAYVTTEHGKSNSIYHVAHYNYLVGGKWYNSTDNADGDLKDGTHISVRALPFNPDLSPYPSFRDGDHSGQVPFFCFALVFSTAVYTILGLFFWNSVWKHRWLVKYGKPVRGKITNYVERYDQSRKKMVADITYEYYSEDEKHCTALHTCKMTAPMEDCANLTKFKLVTVLYDAKYTNQSVVYTASKYRADEKYRP